tara:strand:- start:988 stop:1437 length:450 start_codon:yes stop_codon:yes gene_type:complete
MARRKNTRFIDPRYFMNEKMERLDEGILGTEGDSDALAAALYQYMSDVGMRMNVSAEGAMPFRKFLENQIKEGERSNLQRYLWAVAPDSSAKERARILSDATAQEFYRQLENERIYKVGDNQFIIMRRGERYGAVIGNEEDASQHASNW